MARNSTRESLAQSPFTARLKEAQAEAELTNEEAARALGVGLRTYQNWRQGREPRAVSQRFAIARLFGKPLSWFYENGERAA